jgi:2-oxoglutarate ferredoxin oxidoreductase subunit alpha
MADFVEDAFDIAFKYRAPALILSDGLIINDGKGNP